MGKDRQQPVFGFLTPSLSYHWNVYVWRGAHDFCRKMDIKLVTFSGLEIDPEGERPSNRLFDLAQHTQLDGLIVMGGALALDIPVSEFEQFIKRFTHIPVINIGMKLPGMTSIVVDNFKGTYDAVVHMIKDHNCTRMAYLRGPAGHPQADDRYHGFLTAVEDSGLSPGNQLIIQGEFTEYAGRNAAKQLLDLPELPQALVTVDDITAAAAAEYLLSHGVQIPDQLKIMSFDNTEMALSQKVPLSSVAQYPEKQGYEAAAALFGLIHGETYPELIYTPVKPVFRESCGCTTIEQELTPLRCRHEIDQRLKVDVTLQTIAGFNRQVLAILSLQDLKDNLDSLCSMMEFYSCHIVLHPQPEQYLPRKEILYSWHNKGEIFPPGTYSFAEGELLPKQWRPQKHSVLSVVPLFSDREFLGYTLFETSPFMACYAEHMSSQVGNALRQLRLTIERDQRTKELEKSLKSLKDTQAQLIESEKMASLGNLVGGVAHEINTPLGISLTAITFLLEQSQMQSGNLPDLVQRTGEMIQRNLERAAELVRDFKNVAVDQTSEACRTINLKNYLTTMTSGFYPMLIKRDHKLKITGPENLIISTYPGTLFQVLTNLVTNSINHGFEGLKKREITIDFNQNSCDMIQIHYSDNGKGIPEEIVPRLFEPFVTTGRHKGNTGLGMHIAYNLVHQQLNGTIRFKPNESGGSTFIVVFPAAQPETAKQKDITRLSVETVSN